MKTVKVGNVEIGAGKPKIVVPVSGRNQQELSTQLEMAAAVPADLLEFRMDGYEDSLEEAFALIRKSLSLPLLATYRTEAEGGLGYADPSVYASVLLCAAEYADLVDVEMERENAQALMQKIREKGVCVIASFHDFASTPGACEIASRLERMETMGADIVKIAVMPKTKRDVLALLEGTVRADVSVPKVTMSMSELGQISRFLGEWSGSSLTFGSAGKASAPGQMDVFRLKEILNLLH